MANEQYSIIATTYNDTESIISYLNNILRQEQKPSEIVIADGGSKDDTVSKIINYSKNCRIPIKVLYGKRLNISQGYNEAIKACTTDRIGLTGLGNYYGDNCFKLLMKEMDKEQADITYCPIRGYDSNRFSRIYNRTLLNGDEGMILEIASNHGALVKKKVFEELDYFYESFIYAGEDAEFYDLALKSGYKMVCVKEAVCLWDTPMSMKDFVKQIKNYTLANMQIHPNGKLRLERRRAIIRVAVLLTFLTAIILHIRSLTSAILLMLLFTYFLRMKFKYFRGKSLIMNYLWNYIPIYYSFKFRKYQASSYKVTRTSLQ